MRPQIVLRDAEREDAAPLISLWQLCLEHHQSHGGGQVAAWRKPGVAEAAAAFDFNFGDRSRRMVVALIDGTIVGAICFHITTTTPLNLTKTLVITDLMVSPEARRRAVASTLLSATSGAGEDANCESVNSVVPTSARDVNRFLAKLGFGQTSVVRCAQASTLRSRLSSKSTRSKDTGKLIAVRRTMARRQRAHGVFDRVSKRR